MAEEYCPIPEDPQYRAEIRKLQNSDPVNADAIINPLISRMIENTAAVKKQAEDAKTAAETAKATIEKTLAAHAGDAKITYGNYTGSGESTKLITTGIDTKILIVVTSENTAFSGTRSTLYAGQSFDSIINGSLTYTRTFTRVEGGIQMTGTGGTATTVKNEQIALNKTDFEYSWVALG